MQSRYAYPAGAYFCMRKSRQNALGAVPQDPLTLKLRLDTNDAKASSVQRRRYALKVPAAHFMLGNCKPIAESHAAETVGKTSSYLPRRPLPRIGGGSTRSGRKNRAGEQRDDFFGHRKADGADAAAGFLWSASVRSTDLDFSPQKNLNPYPAQLSVKGVCKGESPVPLCPVLLPFAGAKGRPPRRAVLIKPCKRPCPAEGEMKLYHNYCRQPLSHGCAVPASLTQGSL